LRGNQRVKRNIQGVIKGTTGIEIIKNVRYADKINNWNMKLAEIASPIPFACPSGPLAPRELTHVV